MTLAARRPGCRASSAARSSWLIALFYTAIYTGGLINEVTTFAAFTALIVFLPGDHRCGCRAAGGWIGSTEKEPEKHHGAWRASEPTPMCSPPFAR